MSTTKDKSQGPYTVERIEMKGRDWWTVVGPNAGGTPAMDNATAKDLCDRLNAAYQAGQADRDKIDKSGEAVRGTGKVLTEQWVNACIGALERALHPVVIHGATTDTEDVRHAITTLRYARDNGYLSAPAKAPAGMVEAGNAMKEAIGQIAYELEEGMPLTDDSLCITEAERTVSKWDAALKSTNTPERRPGECDYRKRECVNDGKTVNGVWVCNNHLSNTPQAVTVEGIMELVDDCIDMRDGDGSCVVWPVLDEDQLRTRLDQYLNSR